MARQERYRVFAVASSAGGLNALSVLLAAIPVPFPSPLICVQHVHRHQPSFLADILSRRCAMPVEFVAGGVVPRPGAVLVAPPDRHVVMQGDGSLQLWDGPPVNHVRPSADLLFSSVAAVAGERAVAVVLTGTGHDGAAGAAAVRERGGTVVVQSPQTCEFPGMVDSTLRLVAPDHIVDLPDLGAALGRLAAEVAA